MKFKNLLKTLALSVALLGFSSKAKSEELNIWNYALTTNNIRSRHIYNAHNTNSLEGLDSRDDLLDYPYTNSQWLGGYTLSGSNKFRRDSAPLLSERVFTNCLTIFDQTGQGVSCSNRLHFSINNDTSNRIFTGKVIYSDEQQFIDIRNLIANNNGYFYLRDLKNGTNNQVYCILEISSRLLAPPKISNLNFEGSDKSLEVIAQPGTFITPQYSSLLSELDNWASMSNRTYIPPTQVNFNKSPLDTNYQEKTRIPDSAPNTNDARRFYRLTLSPRKEE